ncbi:MAG: DUF5060 domain-containing protein [Cyclobacteriaceae bacterium]|nr:DUF5060 domain-containing protein [Cyclobacteriaceae bacterium]
MKLLNHFLLMTALSMLSTQAFSSPEIMGIYGYPDTLGRFDKFEARIALKATYENPFDPSEIDIYASFTSPTGKIWKINGFYNYSDWRSLWMLRFSPDEAGLWQYVLHVKDQTGETDSESIQFVVVPSKYHGPIQVAGNKRYLEYKDGTPYYGVGFWYNDSYAAFNKGRIEGDELDNLKELGVNFISNFITPIETMASGLGRYDQNICGRLDEVFEMCENREILISLNLWFHSYLSETVWGGGNIRWQTNPYQTVTGVKDFFRSEKAWEYQEMLYRYFIARWGYSRSLALWFVVDEVNGTDGWVSGDSLGAAIWGKKVHDYLKENDPYHHLTTGTRSGGITQFWHEGYQIFDIASREIYEAQGFAINKKGKVFPQDTHPLTHSYNNYAQEVKKLWDGYEKPAIIGETGWDHTFYEPGMPGYLAQYHNALWVSLSTGSAMTPFWWAHSNFVNDNMITNQIRNFRRFTDEIPFSKLTNLARAEVSLSEGDAFGMVSDQLVFGWVADPKVDVAGDTVTISSLKRGKYKVRIFHTWRGRFIYEEEIETMKKALSFTIPVLYIEGSHAGYVGNDIAFVVEKLDK